MALSATLRAMIQRKHVRYKKTLLYPAKSTAKFRTKSNLSQK